MKFIVGMTCALALASGVAGAGERTGRITSVHLAQQHVDKVFVQIDGAYTNQLAPNATVDTLKTFLAQLMSAQASGTRVMIFYDAVSGCPEQIVSVGGYSGRRF